jgi:NHLM bacteriocin system ABC transporter ATP-binding protein
MSEGLASGSGATARAGAAAAEPVPIALEAQRPLAFDGQTLALRVLRGHVDLFAVEQTAGGEAGQRHHMLRAEAGATIFGLPPVAAANGHPAVSVIAVGGQDTQVVTGHRDAIAEREVIDGWVVLLSEAIAVATLDAGAQQARIGSDLLLAKGGMIRAPHSGVAWLGFSEGTLRLMDAPMASVDADSALPLASNMWLRAESETTLAVKPSEALSLGELWAGLDRFHALAMKLLSARIAAASAEEAERLRSRSRLGRLRTHGIVDRLAGIIDPGLSSGELHHTGRGGVLAACREVGHALGVAIEAPANRDADNSDVAHACLIAQASQLRARRVLLRGDWWISSVGPLVVFAGEGRRPLAILPGARNRYLVVEPDTGRRRALTPELAAELAPEAVMFYRTLPPLALRRMDLLRFAGAVIKADLLRIILATLAVGILGMAAPLVMKVLIDSVIPRAEIGQLAICALALAVVTLATTSFRLMQGIAMLRLESVLDRELQAAVVDRLLRLPVGFFRQYSVGDLTDRALGIESVRAILTGRVIRGLLASVSCLISFVLMFYYDYRLAFVAAGLALVRGAIAIGTGLLRLSHERVNFALQGWLHGVVLQFVAGVGKLRAANATTHAFAVWVERYARQKHHFIASQRLANLHRSFEGSFAAIATVVILAAGEHLSGATLFRHLGSFLAFFAAFAVSLATMREWATALAELVIAVPRLDRLQPIVATATESSGERKVLGQLTGAIEFAKVSFRYEAGGAPILDNVSLSVGKGEYVAIVGPSGSGKSTLFRLLLGFEKPEAGVIFVDGRSIETIDIASFRRHVGVVLQNSRLASGSIYDNICGGAQLPVEQAWEAARLAGLDRDIEAMPMGMHTWISEGVATMSGGQRQRLMIARALVHRPRILLLDEATSALDNRTQAIVSESVSRLNVTRIVIAHRLSTVQSADRIVVLAGGRIVQSGSYAELTSQQGLFADFAARQLV